MNLRKINSTITDQHYKALKDEASKRAVSISEILRRALDVWMDANEAKLREKATTRIGVARSVPLADRKPTGAIK